MKIIAYIDAFNFYYGLTKGTKYRWCDLYKLCSSLMPNHNVELVRLFTGRSKALDDPRQPERQNTYLRALEIKGNVWVCRSTFTVRPKEFYLYNRDEKVTVRVPREKGADVNLATYLLVDAYNDNFDLAMIVSNDSDLEQPVLMVRKVFRKRIRIFAPIKSEDQWMSDKLIRAAGHQNHEIIPFDLVTQCQLPNPVTRKNGKPLYKPKEWESGTD